MLRQHPFRERSWTASVRALHGDGRRTDATRTAQRARATLADVGIEPGAELSTAERLALTGGIGPPASGLAAAHGPTSGYVEVEGSRVAYATLGERPQALLFLHGGFVPFEVMGDEPRLARFLDTLAQSSASS